MKKVFLFSVLGMFLLTHVSAQKTPIVQIGSDAPSFTAMSTNGKIKFPADFGSNWKILFSHPKDFTPVCSSEVLELAYAQKDFEKMGVKLAVISTDILEQHNSWKSALEDISYKDRGPVKINFPIIADDDMKISRQYGMLHDATSSTLNIRGVYFINPDNKISAMYFYPNEVGRSLDELKRTLTALQTTYENDNLATPANWQKGDDVLVPVLTKEQENTLGGADSDLYQVAWFMTFRSK